MTLALVVTTLGRLDPLEALLASLHGQCREGDEVVLVAQGRLEEVTALAARHADAVPVRVTTSERGATRGRNTGAAWVVDPAAVLMFPNDTSVFPPGTLDAVRAATADAEVVGGALTSHDERGPKAVLPDAGTPLDRHNLWSVIEMGLFLRRGLFDELGGFALDIGPGQSSPWQAGEVSDLLLRALEAHPDLPSHWVWLSPDVHVDGISTGFGLTDTDRRRKLRTYGRGTAQVFARHRYPLWWRTAFVLAGLVHGVRQPAPVRAMDGWWMFLGRLEGTLGRTFGARQLVSTRV